MFIPSIRKENLLTIKFFDWNKQKHFINNKILKFVLFALFGNLKSVAVLVVKTRKGLWKIDQRYEFESEPNQ